MAASPQAGACEETEAAVRRRDKSVRAYRPVRGDGEERSGKRLLNFLGGKGAGNETPRQTATREVREETSGLLSEATMRAVEQTPATGVAYHPRSKAVLFVHRLRGLTLSDVSAPGGLSDSTCR